MREVNTKIDVNADSTSLKPPSCVPKFLTKKNLGKLFTLCRPWQRVRRESFPNAVFVLAKQNYKVRADIGLAFSVRRRYVVVLDTGAGPNFINITELDQDVHELIEKKDLPDIYDANNRPLSLMGTITLSVRLGSYSLSLPFIVCANLAAPAILGADFCDQHVEAIRPRMRSVELADGSCIPILRKAVMRSKRAVLPDWLKPVVLPTKKKESREMRVHLAQAAVIPPQSQVAVHVKTRIVGLMMMTGLDSLYHDRQLAVANGIVQSDPSRRTQILIANFSNVPRKLPKGKHVATFSPCPDYVVESPVAVGEAIGTLETCNPKRAATTGQVAAQTALTVEESSYVPPKEPSTEHRSDSWGGTERPSAKSVDLSHVPKDYAERFRKMLEKHDDMWSGHLGEITTVQHHIDLKPGARPIYQKPRRTGLSARKFVGEEVDRMLKAKVIEPAQCEWASPLVLAPKSDGSFRFCVDYRKLNEVTIKDTYPLPRMDDCIDSLGEATVFSSLDANWGYWQIAVADEDKDKTAFTSHVGTYRFLRMPFGLTNAPATFQRTLDILLSKYNWRTCLVYLDDVIIFSKNLEEHLVHVDEVLTTLRAAGISLKLAKCSWCTDKINYLGHTITPGKLSINAAHTAGLLGLVPPRTLTELKSFLGFVNVYRRFVRDFAKIAYPLYEILKGRSKTENSSRNVPIPALNAVQLEAFEALKQAVASPEVLALPRPDLPFSLDTDASDYQLGAALFQVYGDKDRRPIGFWSRTLNPAEQNYSTPEKECLAVIWALQTLRPYLQGTHFVVHSDQSSLRWLMEIEEPSGKLMRWRLRLSEFDFEVKYKLGLINTQADAMSRLASTGSTTTPIDEEIPVFPKCPDPQDPALAMENFSAFDMTEVTPHLLEEWCYHDESLFLTSNSHQPLLTPVTRHELKTAQLADDFCRTTRAQLNRGGGRGGKHLPFFVDDEGILHRTTQGLKQVCVPAALRRRVLELAHHSYLTGHPGGRRMYKYLHQYAYWPSMSVDCYNTVKHCTQCARNRVMLRRRQKNLRLFPATAPLESVAIDILGELLVTERGNRFLLVITDRFSKLVRTIPLPKITAQGVAEAFVKAMVPGLWTTHLVVV